MMFKAQSQESIGRPGPIPRVVAFAALVIAAVGFAACSTTEGFGNDVKHLGGNIEDSAAKNK